MPVQSDSIIYCIDYTKTPEGNKIYSHISSIIPGKESNQRTSDKVENEATSEQTRTSTNLRREERKRKCIPHNYKYLLYFAFKIALQKSYQVSS